MEYSQNGKLSYIILSIEKNHLKYLKKYTAINTLCRDRKYVITIDNNTVFSLIICCFRPSYNEYLGGTVHVPYGIFLKFDKKIINFLV